MRIAVLGAESTGKTTLAQAMGERLRARGHRVAVVDETLRGWCERAGRMPSPAEAAGIARAHEARVDEALGGQDIVVADTTALVAALYGGLNFPDDPTWRWSLERQRAYPLTLLTGTDLPWRPDGLHRAGPHERDGFDALLRQALQQAGIGWRVVYGQGQERTLQALEALAEAAPWAWTPREEVRPRWVGACEACSDPDCERKLFTRLRG